MDRLYVDLRDAEDPHYVSCRDRIEAMWSPAKRHLDADFENAFSRNCVQRFWELRLCVALLELGYALDDAGEGRPDFGTWLQDGHRLWIEAVAPTLGASCNPDRAPPPRSGGRFGPAPVAEIALRYAQALEEKRSAFERYRARGVVGDDDCCIIALSSAGLWPHVEGVGAPRILRFLFGLGEERISIDRSAATVAIDYDDRTEVLRSNGSAVGMGAFLSPNFRGIGGVIHHSGRPTGFGDDAARFVSIANPRAARPGPPGFFGLGREYAANIGEDGSGVITVVRGKTTA